MNRRATVAGAIVLLSMLAAVAAADAQPALPEVGHEVPDFTLPTLDGDAVALSEGRAKGPVVLVFFRGAW